MYYAKFVHKYVLTILIMFREVIIRKKVPKLKKVPIIVPIVNQLLSLYYYFCYGLVPYTIELDDESSMQFWVSKHRHHGSPNLVLIHGCGGHALWQFALQMKSLSKSFNIYIPDLLFFGKSYTKSNDRSPEFQAKCIMKGLKKGFGVNRCSVYAISYGGWVGYRLAEMYPKKIEKIVIVSSGIGCSSDQKLEQLKQISMPIQKLVVPNDPNALRLLVKKSVHKYSLKWVPDFILWESIKVMDDKNRKAKEELVMHLMSNEANSQISKLSQDTLLVWGDQDKFFPTDIAYQLQRMIGSNASVEILEGVGHAVNIDAPSELNSLIKSFILDH
ncbi:hypothetical protein RND81_01G065700 [Saponaria officinalis]|uniref:AB hydrolase-1 domain-containing protein n=1 Tax=Saponaria officinalis TaxID=3572 RepID=A0AAW1NDG3_SAPOF